MDKCRKTGKTASGSENENGNRNFESMHHRHVLSHLQSAEEAESDRVVA
jgi:hypothetical protein